MMEKNKKRYIRPKMVTYEMKTVAPILAGSLPSEMIPPELAPFINPTP